jgi:microcystin-dependent protein
VATIDPFVGEIRVFPFNFAPSGWALCNGQILPITQNTALFSILGTTYGGDGKVTFALPNLRDSVPMQAGQGPGLSFRELGESGGADAVTLLQSEIPAHSHSLAAANFPADIQAPTPNVAIARSSGGNAYQANVSQNLVQMNASTLAPSGGDLPHNNLQPYLTLNFCIALQGVFPPRWPAP